MEEILINEIRGWHVGKQYTIKCNLKDMENVIFRVEIAYFECPSCASIIQVKQKGDVLKNPELCSCGRKSKFDFLREKSQRIEEQIIYVTQKPRNFGIVHDLKCYLIGEELINKLEKVKQDQEIVLAGKIGIEQEKNQSGNSLNLGKYIFHVKEIFI